MDLHTLAQKFADEVLDYVTNECSEEPLDGDETEAFTVEFLEKLDVLMGNV